MTLGLNARRKGVNAYKALHLASAEEYGVKEGSIIIQMLLDGLSASLASISLALKTGDPYLLRQSVLRSNHILSGLTVSFDADKYPGLAEDLLAVYAYMMNRLDRLSLSSDQGELSELLTLARSLSKAWNQLPAGEYPN